MSLSRWLGGLVVFVTTASSHMSVCNAQILDDSARDIMHMQQRERITVSYRDPVSSRDVSLECRPAGDAPGAGRVTVYNRSQPWSNPVQITAPRDARHFGYLALPTGDVDGDGLGDIGIMSVQGNDFPDIMVRLSYYSSRSGLRLAYIDSNERGTLHLQGDVNHDGIVDAHDLLIASGVVDGSIRPDEQTLRDCDVDNDGMATKADLLGIHERHGVRAENSSLRRQLVEPWSGSGPDPRISWSCFWDIVFLTGRIVAFLATLGVCELNPPLCTISLICQGCGILTNLLSILNNCFGVGIPQNIMDVVGVIQNICDLCSIITGAVASWKDIVKGWKKLKDWLLSSIAGTFDGDLIPVDLDGTFQGTAIDVAQD